MFAAATDYGVLVAYYTDIQNTSTNPVALELVINERGAPPKQVFPCGPMSAYMAKADKYSLREACTLMPGQTMRIGGESAYFSVIPFEGDTLLVKSVTGSIRRITAGSISAFITDTTSERQGVEGPLAITYTIRLR